MGIQNYVPETLTPLWSEPAMIYAVDPMQIVPLMFDVARATSGPLTAPWPLGADFIAPLGNVPTGGKGKAEISTDPTQRAQEVFTAHVSTIVERMTISSDAVASIKDQADRLAAIITLEATTQAMGGMVDDVFGSEHLTDRRLPSDDWPQVARDLRERVYKAVADLAQPIAKPVGWHALGWTSRKTDKANADLSLIDRLALVEMVLSWGRVVSALARMDLERAAAAVHPRTWATLRIGSILDAWRWVSHEGFLIHVRTAELRNMLQLASSLHVLDPSTHALAQDTLAELQTVPRTPLQNLVTNCLPPIAARPTPWGDLPACAVLPDTYTGLTSANGTAKSAYMIHDLPRRLLEQISSSLTQARAALAMRRALIAGLGRLPEIMPSPGVSTPYYPSFSAGIADRIVLTNGTAVSESAQDWRDLVFKPKFSIWDAQAKKHALIGALAGLAYNTPDEDALKGAGFTDIEEAAQVFMTVARQAAFTPTLGVLDMSVARHVLSSEHYQGQPSASFPRRLESIATEHGLKAERLLSAAKALKALPEGSNSQTEVIYDRLFDHSTMAMLELKQQRESVTTYAIVANMGAHAYVRSNAAYGIQTPSLIELGKPTTDLLQAITSFWMRSYT